MSKIISMKQTEDISVPYTIPSPHSPSYRLNLKVQRSKTGSVCVVKQDSKKIRSELSSLTPSHLPESMIHALSQLSLHSVLVGRVS